RLRVLQGELELAGEFVHSHVGYLLIWVGRECVGWDKSGVASGGIQGEGVDKFDVGQGLLDSILTSSHSDTQFTNGHSTLTHETQYIH
ncbi:MAG: hypothetical protein BWK73_46155, partial [Thiothrix lacustris]